VVRHKKEMIAALKNGGGDERRRVFKYWEEEYGVKLGRGERGYRLYCELLDLVKKAGDEKAVEEFRNRFLVLCDTEVVAVAAAAERVEVKEEEPKKGLLGKLFGR
jgi:hypothetical protein